MNLNNHNINLSDSELELENELNNNFNKEIEKNSKNYIDEIEKELEMIMSNKPIIDINLSEEQKKIINSKTNIKVDAVAGSGKTTTILHMGLENKNKKIFQITYNNLLKREVRKKSQRLCLKNMEIHTYHSLAVKYYNPNAYTDEEIKKIISSNMEIKKEMEIEPFDILFIDETQDMIYDYYRLVKKFINDTNSKPQIIIMGDKYQGIYNFKGADVKFLTLGDKIWLNNKMIKNKFESLNLSTSYRLTNQISWFVNNVMLGYNRINTIKNGPKVDYYISNPFKIYKKIGLYLINQIESNNALPSDIFVLIPSLKTIEAPYKKLENYLVKHGIKCITPISDDSKLDEKTISNKVVFTTYHQAKGRERKIVILYNFDNLYLEYYSKETIINYNICPNILYVGATRASEKLILIQDFNSKPLKFLNQSRLNSNDFLNIIQTESKSCSAKSSNKLKQKKEKKKINVTDLVKFISPTTLDILIPLIENNLFIEIKSSNLKLISIPNKIEIRNNNNIILWEDVSDLNGLVIPAIYETKINNSTSTIEDFVKKKFEDFNIIAEYSKYVGKINIPCKTIRDFLKVGNIYLSLQNKLHAKVAQIKKYNWLEEKMVSKCHEFMNMIDTNTLFEIVIKSDSKYDFALDWMEYDHEIYGLIELRGRLDAITMDSVWEFKCVDCLLIEHKLQLVVYYWMWYKAEMNKKYGNKNFFIINIKSGQILQLDINKLFLIEQIVEILFDEKYIRKKELNDFEFVNMCISNT